MNKAIQVIVLMHIYQEMIIVDLDMPAETIQLTIARLRDKGLVKPELPYELTEEGEKRVTLLLSIM